MTERNWQEDMNLCMKVDEAWSRELFIADQPDITTYWLQQYAAAESLIQQKDAEIYHLKMSIEALLMHRGTQVHDEPDLTHVQPEHASGDTP
ncbi:hypothetical protein [Paenibacillus polymyxa]|uniref:hypothetical protein n=1 Tax=Paenibacillus polymyxa TaxID=1406 RepID=UPI0003FA39D7|nr:hypothetical protein [Paenibacillus polymyxa]